MDRVDEAAERYLGKWNEQYSLVNDKEIVIWQVDGAMRDIEQWIEGRDPNGAKEMAGVEDWTRDELISLYKSLSPTAAFFGYTVNQYRGTDGPP